MFFLNLSAGEFFALLGVVSAGITALYFLDRARRKKVVSTLRFWTGAASSDQQQSRKKMREPWSLLLQLLSLLLLLLAIAQLQWGTRERQGRDHVLLLDTSSWSGELNGSGTLLDREKSLAVSYVNGLRSRDRVMVVRSDGLATPATQFTSNRTLLNQAINASTPSFSSLNVEQALSFAQQAQEWSGGQGGEIVYIGPKLVEDTQTSAPNLANLRTITVPANANNSGIRRVDLKINGEKPDAWLASVTVKNYGSQARVLRVNAQFANTRFTPRLLQLAPGEERSAEYSFVTNVAGRFAAQIDPGDDLRSDDRVELALPRNSLLNVAVFTSRPEVLRPLFGANRRLNVSFHSPGEFTAKTVADLVVLDRMPKGQTSKISALWIQPPKDNAPLPIKSVDRNAVITSWDTATGLGSGLHAKEVRLPESDVFGIFGTDIAVAKTAAGAVTVARNAANGAPKAAFIGFDPFAGELRYDITTPLLFANLLRWLAPDAFRTLDFSAGHTGAQSITLDRSETAGKLSIADENGMAVPFTVRNQTLEMFVNRPSIIRIASDDRERTLSLTLPDVAETRWRPTGAVADGLPAAAQVLPSATDLWQWLAVLGGLGLLAEWLIYGRQRALKKRTQATAASTRTVTQRERELAAK